MSHLFSCKPQRELPTVAVLDIEKYAGTWHEIARLPNRFERGLTCVTAEYSLKENGKIRVKNKGFNADKNQWKEATGTAWIPDSQFPGQLRVRFFWPFAGDYYVIYVDEAYRLALVGDPARDYLWILSKDPNPEKERYDELVSLAKKLGFATENLAEVKRECE
jgi:apolipoprotein D and lipocalin family protein